jgi:predicted GIY-YIG superfamily endonuclease
MNWYVYVLQSRIDGRLYKGMTKNRKKGLSSITRGKYGRRGDIGPGY